VIEDLLPAWGGEEVVVRFDEPSATWMLVGVHSTVLGPAAGGTRMKTYAQPADGLRDVLRLSSAMTSKMAMASVPLGGGRSWQRELPQLVHKPEASVAGASPSAAKFEAGHGGKKCTMAVDRGNIGVCCAK